VVDHRGAQVIVTAFCQPYTLMKHLTIALLVMIAGAPVWAREQAIQLDIAAGKVGEVCMPLQAGDTLAWEWKASVATDFNLHQHVGKEVQMPVKRQAVAQERAQHKVDRSNDWCLMWKAPAGQAATVEGAWRVIGATAQ
jgi:hypothetical protein